MARTVRDQKITNRTQRLALSPRGKPYFRAIRPGLHIGYRRLGGDQCGAWVLKRHLGGDRYETRVIGYADDFAAPGRQVMTFAEAQRAVVDLAERMERADLGMEPDPSKPYRVSDALDDYLRWFALHRKSLLVTTRAVEKHIRPALGDLTVADLTTRRIREWHEALASAPRGNRAKPKGPEKGAPAPAKPKASADPEAVRARRSTANRLLTVLKAALNHAFVEGRTGTDQAWRRVRPFRGADAARMRYLTHEDIARLLNACEGGFRDLVATALATGCRYGELGRLKVGDYDSPGRVLLVRTTKSGKPRAVPLDDFGVRLLDRLTAGRKAGETLLRRDDGDAWGPSEQQRPLAATCARARIEPPATFHILRHTFASLRVMAGMSLQVLAKILGHTSTRITERHYAHLADDHIRQEVERTAIALPMPETNVQLMKRTRHQAG